MNSTPKRNAIRPQALIFLVCVGLLLGAFSWFVASDLTTRVENNTRKVVDHAIPIKDMGWVSAKVDGTMVYLSGEAPEQIARVRVSEAMAKKINVSRIVNEIVAPDVNIDAPEVRVEIVQNERVSSIIGLLPREPSPVDLYRALDRAKPLINTLNLVEDTSSEAGDVWGDQLAFMSAIVGEVENVKISATPGVVKINAVATTDEVATNLRKKLTEIAPQNVDLQLNITSPRPLITPFDFSLNKDGDMITLDKCSATDRDDLVAMRAAFRGLDATAIDSCKLGLGAPTENWGALISDLLTQFIGADRFGINVEDNQIRLQISDQLSEDESAGQIAKVKKIMPAGFGLETELLTTKRTIEDLKADGKALKLTFEKHEDGKFVVNGVLGSASGLENLKGFAIAKFGTENVEFDVDIIDDLPITWEKNAFTSLQVMAAMKDGQTVITKDQILFQGDVESREVRMGLEQMLNAEIQDAQVSQEITINNTVAEIVDGVLVDAPAESPSSCLEKINDQMDNAPIQFEQSSTKVAASSEASIQAVSEILATCSSYGFEIAGHTDSQGGDAVNLRVSEQRAKSVLDAILNTNLEFGNLTSKGFGLSEPIASNDTAEGRAKNRRIEIRLITKSGE